MRRLFSLIVVLSLPALLAAADEGKPNTLTPQEAADGWLLLFDGSTTFGLRSPNDSKWTVLDGLLAPQADKPGLLVTTTAFQEYDLHLEYQTKAGTRAAVLIGCDANGRPPMRGGEVMLEPLGGWLQMRIKVRGGVVDRTSLHSRGAVNIEVPARQVPAVNPINRSGHIALSGNGIIFRNIKLKPMDMKPLFNGRDLSGWKEHPGKKSNFSVTPEGWLHIQDGPGDLQSERQWADFVLQIDCLSNGDRLNSGVFFRCRPNEYQQGYEAQIHNGFNEANPKEYTLEDYDPQTHELKGKRKVKYAALDYGTGAIYRRQPARQAVAKDREWFTMTVAAQGRHIAVWVNGILVTDWTDYRPLKDNARNGCRLDKGPISLQGHDPTTDLSFRNIRIGELSAQKGP
jgi:hypothetical protein